MKKPSAWPLLAALLHLLAQSACFYSHSENDLILEHSALDLSLGSFPKKDTCAESSCTHFQTVLLNNHLSPPLVGDLTNILETSDLIHETPTYHGYTHSARVGNVTATVLSSQHGSALTPYQKILFTVAALLHDIDPERVPGTPPRIAATFVWFDKDERVKKFFDDLARETPITKEQIKSVIKYTDFNIDPPKLLALIDEADKMVERNFDKVTAPIVKIWGRRLAYFDQVANYVGSYAFAQQTVIGLAHEFRNLKGELEKAKGIIDPVVTSPSDIEILSNTSNFLLVRLKDPLFNLLPENMQNNFHHVQLSFEENWTGKK